MEQPKQAGHVSEEGILVNKGKELAIEVTDQRYERIPVATHVLFEGEDIVDVASHYLDGLTQTGDWIVISEKAVAATQGRAIPVEDIKPSMWARTLSRYVSKVPYGIGLSMPETMEMAIREVGLPRILFAAACSACTRPFGVKGVFYHVAGRQAAAIDGPTPSTLPPYNRYVVLAPADPDGVSHRIMEALGHETAIVDVNDLGSEVLGATPGIDRQLLRQIMRDNPLGQGHEQTPLGIIRKDLSQQQVAAAGIESPDQPESGR